MHTLPSPLRLRHALILRSLLLRCVPVGSAGTVTTRGPMRLPSRLFVYVPHGAGAVGQGYRSTDTSMLTASLGARMDERRSDHGQWAATTGDGLFRRQHFAFLPRLHEVIGT